MRDIGDRILRYRLSRYAPQIDRVRRRLRWAWIAGALWLVWVGFLSEHSFYRIWQLDREQQLDRRELAQLAAESEQLEREATDPRRRRVAAEAYLREKAGMARPGEIIYQRR